MENTDMLRSFSHRSFEDKEENRSIANAMRALQQKIRNLEVENENLENHVRYLQETPNVSQNTVQETLFLKEKLWKSEEEKLVLGNKADFFEKELQRKEKQFQIDRETWLLQQKTLQKALEKARGSAKPLRKKKSIQRPQQPKADLEEKLVSDLEYVKKQLETSEKARIEGEAIIFHLRKAKDEVLRSLQDEIYDIQQNPCDMCGRMQAEVEFYKNQCDSQRFQIEKLIFEVEEWKNNCRKTENVVNCMKNYCKAEVNELVPNEYKGNLDDIEGEVEQLSKKYKELLDLTRGQGANYPELRSELKKTAFDLEVASFQLYQSHKSGRPNA